MKKFTIPNGGFRSTDYEYEGHLNLSIQWNRWLLKPMGLWPILRTVSKSRYFLYRLINVVCYSLLGFVFVSYTLYVFFEVKDLYNKLKLCGPWSFCIMAIAKYYSMIVHGEDILECVEHIEWDWKNVRNVRDRRVMIVNAIFGRKLIKICTFLMCSGFVFYYIIIPLTVGRVSVENENETLNFMPLLFPLSTKILDTRCSPANEIVLTIQIVSGALLHAIMSAACSLIAAFAVHACGQMQILMNWLEELIDGSPDTNDTVDDRIASIVCQHVRILKFLTLTERTVRQISFAEFLGCTLGICLLGYYIIMESKSREVTSTVTYTIILMSLVSSVFIFCYIGEIVEDQSRRIGEMSYMIEWYRLQGNKKLCCVMIMAMSNSSIKLTAGKMVELSISTFADIIKTASAFLNVLRTLA